MNINNILKDIDKVDDQVYERPDTRRAVLKSFAGMSGRVAMTALPLALGSFFKKANARTTNDAVVAEAFNFMLTVEYLQAEFYMQALMANNLIGNDIRQQIITIGKHETAHVNFLRAAITAANGTPITKPTFDFSGGKGSGNGPFKAVFSDFTTFLEMAQVFEDLSVRAYKERVFPLQLHKETVALRALLQIQSVEARHAAYIRKLRKDFGSGVGNVKPWITRSQSGINNESVQSVYDGENLIAQYSSLIIVPGINGFDISEDAATEAFDEATPSDLVLSFIDPFIVD